VQKYNYFNDLQTIIIQIANTALINLCKSKYFDKKNNFFEKISNTGFFIIYF